MVEVIIYSTEDVDLSKVDTLKCDVHIYKDGILVIKNPKEELFVDIIEESVSIGKPIILLAPKRIGVIKGIDINGNEIELRDTNFNIRVEKIKENESKLSKFLFGRI